MNRPIAGQPYTVVKGDTLIGIAKAAYGDGGKFKLIWKANQSNLRGATPNEIFPGEVLNLPKDPTTEALKKSILGATIPGKDQDDFTLVIDGVEFPAIAGTVLDSLDNAAIGFTAKLFYDVEDDRLAEILKPYSYTPAAVYLGGELAVDGFIYTITNRLDDSGLVKELEGWSPTADIIDSTIKPPYEAAKITLEERARDLCEPHGIKVVFELPDDPKFDRVTAEAEDTVFDHLAELATQRAGLLTSTPAGELLFTQAATGAPVGTIEEGRPPYTSMEIAWDGRARWAAYRAIGQSPKKKTKIAISKDPEVPRPRFLTFSADDTTTGGIQKAADWRRSKVIADALVIDFPVNSWYAPNGERWKKNTLLTVISPSMHLADGFDFLIKAVESSFSDTGTPAKLSLVPPQVYTGEEIAVGWT